jgi:hypothetical protein
VLVEIRECLLSFGAETFVFQFPIKNFKESNKGQYNFAGCFELVGFLVAHIEVGT